MLKEKFVFKTQLVKHQTGTIRSLEEITQNLHISHDTIIQLMQKVRPQEELCKGKIVRPVVNTPTLTPQKGASALPQQDLLRRFATNKPGTEPDAELSLLRKLESSLQLQKLYNETLHDQHNILKQENSSLKSSMEAFQLQLTGSYTREKQSWQQYVSLYKASTERELSRKQLEVKHLNELLAQ